MRTHTLVTSDKAAYAMKMKYQISRTEHEEIAKQSGDAAVLLYIHYLRTGAMKEPDFSDENAVASLYWDIRKVARLRLVLEKLGYFHHDVARTNGIRVDLYHLGKRRKPVTSERRGRQAKEEAEPMTQAAPDDSAKEQFPFTVI